MRPPMLLRPLLLSLLCSCASAQVLSFPMPGGKFSTGMAMDAIESGQLESNLFTIGTMYGGGPGVQSLTNSLSKLDLKAPSKARREYVAGYRFLMRKDLQSATEHLTRAISIYPRYVAAHNALGTAYLDLHQNERAREEFKHAVALDDHLPNSSLNLGIAELALKEYPAAEEALRKASSIAPLDLQLSTALIYGEFMNHDYPAVIAAAQEVHSRTHRGAALVHFFAAGALQAQDHFPEAQREMQTLLKEDAASLSAAQFNAILEQMKIEEGMRAEAKRHPAQAAVFKFDAPAKPTASEASQQAQHILQSVREKNQIAEAEAADSSCVECGSAVSPQASPAPAPAPYADSGHRPKIDFSGPTFRTAADEVAIFFAATDHGKSVTNLTPADLQLRDDNRPPQAILGFRNESQLPLRLGLVIDSSDSVKDRLTFESTAAARFLQQVVTRKDDLSFVIGVNNSVLMVQDFTNDSALATRAVNQLAAGGGTALWDAAAFAADKLAKHAEVGPVARILVIISDGEDNSSQATLKQAIAAGQRGEVAVYTVSTRDNLGVAVNFATMEDQDVGDHALRTLSELTGGTILRPGSVRHLSKTLAELQQVLRSRYMISYKPTSFQRNGRYREIDLRAQKDGRKLKVFARKGYYASAPQTESAD